MAIHSSILAWIIAWTEEPGGLPFMGPQRVRRDCATNSFQFGMKGDVTLWVRPGQTTSLLMVSLEAICVKSRQSSSLAQSSKLQAHTRHFLSFYKLISHVSSAIKHKSTYVIQVPSDFFFLTATMAGSHLIPFPGLDHGQT